MTTEVIVVAPLESEVETFLLPPLGVTTAAVCAAAAGQDEWMRSGGGGGGDGDSTVSAATLTVLLPLLDGSSQRFSAQWRRRSHPLPCTATEATARVAIAAVVLAAAPALTSEPHPHASSTADDGHGAAPQPGPAAAGSTQYARELYHRARRAVAPLEEKFAELALVLWAACGTAPDPTQPSYLYHTGAPPAAVLLTGPAGSGKTTAVRAMAAALGATLVQYERPSDASDAAAEMDRCFDRAAAQQPSIILVDDGHTVFPPKDRGDESVTRPAAMRFIRHLWMIGPTQATAVVVVAPQDPRCVDGDVVASLLDHIAIALPTPTETLAVLESSFRGTATWATNVDLTLLAEQCRGRSLSDLTALASFALRFSLESGQPDDGSNPTTLPAVTRKAADAALRCLATGGNAAGVGGPTAVVPTRGAGWSGVVRMDGLKEQLNRVLVRPFSAPRATLEALGLRLPRGLLLFGAPGSGKTLFARAVAAEAGLAVVELTLRHLARGEIGESERAVAAAFQEAKRFRPCAVLLDDADVVFRRRANAVNGGGGGGGGGIGTGVVSQLLIEVDRAPEGVVVIATSSSPERVDPALLQAGRIDHRLHVHLPDADARMQLLQSACGRLHTPADIDWVHLGAATAGLTPADLQSVARKAAYVALGAVPADAAASPTVTATMLEQCIESTAGSTNAAREEWYAKWGDV